MKASLVGWDSESDQLICLDNDGKQHKVHMVYNSVDDIKNNVPAVARVDGMIVEIPKTTKCVYEAQPTGYVIREKTTGMDLVHISMTTDNEVMIDVEDPIPLSALSSIIETLQTILSNN